IFTSSASSTKSAGAPISTPWRQTASAASRRGNSPAPTRVCWQFSTVMIEDSAGVINRVSAPVLYLQKQGYLGERDPTDAGGSQEITAVRRGRDAAGHPRAPSRRSSTAA